MKVSVSLNDFALKIKEMLFSDRDVVIVVSGFTGEGKSVFTSQLAKEYAKVAGTHWGFDRMTWSRKELMTWIDGEPKTKAGRLPEYSVIVPDELFLMFYKRTWYEGDQVDAIATFNMCRDRHLLVIGNVPKFWDLDNAFTARIRFYVYIPYRGIAWVFEQENNPFTEDAWNVSENKKFFRRKNNPFGLKNFLFEVRYGDWSEGEKEEYLAIRNTKRVDAIDDSKSDKVEKYRKIKKMRDGGMKWVAEELYVKDGPRYRKPSQTEIANKFGVNTASVSEILNGQH